VKVRARTSSLAAVLVAVAGCGGGDADTTLDADGYSFTYPGQWDELEPPDYSAQTRRPVSLVGLGPGEAANFLTVAVYELPSPVTESNIDQTSDATAEQLQQGFQQSDGRITAGPTQATIGGLPAFRIEGSLMSTAGRPIQSPLIFMFDGRTEYFLNCQFTRENAEEMKRDCE
jgi:hypothetical protein